MKQSSQDEATYQQQSNNRKKTKKAALNFAEEKLQTKEMHHKINGSVTELQKELLKSNKKEHKIVQTVSVCCKMQRHRMNEYSKDRLNALNLQHRIVVSDETECVFVVQTLHAHIK